MDDTWCRRQAVCLKSPKQTGMKVNMIDINTASMLFMVSSFTACVVLGVVCLVEDLKIFKRV